MRRDEASNVSDVFRSSPPTTAEPSYYDATATAPREDAWRAPPVLQRAEERDPSADDVRGIAKRFERSTPLGRGLSLFV